VPVPQCCHPCMETASPSQYDSIASMYHSLWANWYLPAAMPALEKLFFARLDPGSRVLDLCCGSGHVTRELLSRGYRVTGVDNSAELIGLAQRDHPGIDFRVQDARRLELPQEFRGVLSTFDSLNHILSLPELRQVFEGVARVLEPGGLFFFDMNLAEAYSADLREWSVDLKDDSVGLVRGAFDPLTRRAATELIWFTRSPNGECWHQRRSTVEQQCYPQSDIVLALQEAGFRNIEVLSAQRAGVTSELGFGRSYFSAETS
jgi:SAM-dependent methyltransferase